MDPEEGLKVEDLDWSKATTPFCLPLARVAESMPVDQTQRSDEPESKSCPVLGVSMSRVGSDSRG